MRFDFKGFEPDTNNSTPGIITACENLIPTLNGYKTANSPVPVGMNPLPGELLASCISSVVAELLDGSRRLFAGTADKLYERAGMGWIDRSGWSYAATRDSPWEFAQFGNSTIAVTAANNMQRSTGAGFTDLVAIKANHIAAVKGFVIAAGTDEPTYGKQGDRWWCSALKNETDWVPNISTQCTTGRLVDSPGEILALRALGENLIAYKDSSIYVGRYVGPPGVWEWRLIPGRVGVASPGSIVDIGNAHLFIGREDLYIFDGNFPQALNSPIKQWLYKHINKSYMSRITHLYDPDNSLVYFFYGAGGFGELPNQCLVYNHKVNKFGRFDPRLVEGLGYGNINLSFIAGLNFIGKVRDGWSLGFMWDTLPIVGKTWNDWPPVSYDSSYWNISERAPAYFGHDNILYSLTGTPLSAQLESWYIGEDSSQHMIRRIRPLYVENMRPAPHTIYVTLLKRLRASSSFDVSKDGDMVDGKFDALSTAPWHQITFKMAGALELSGIELDVVPAGKR